MGQKWRKRAASAPFGVSAIHCRTSRLVDRRVRRERTEVEAEVEEVEERRDDGEKPVGVSVASRGLMVSAALFFSESGDGGAVGVNVKEDGEVRCCVEAVL